MNLRRPFGLLVLGPIEQRDTQIDAGRIQGQQLAPEVKLRLLLCATLTATTIPEILFYTVPSSDAHWHGASVVRFGALGILRCFSFRRSPPVHCKYIPQRLRVPQSWQNSIKQ